MQNIIFIFNRTDCISFLALKNNLMEELGVSITSGHPILFAALFVVLIQLIESKFIPSNKRLFQVLVMMLKRQLLQIIDFGLQHAQSLLEGLLLFTAGLESVLQGS